MKSSENKSRREFIKTTGKATVAAGISVSVLSSFSKDKTMSSYNNVSLNTPYTQQPLPYAYNSLEPFIDTATMEIHYTKHAAAYAKNLLEACTAENVDTKKTALEEVLANISKYSIKMRNNAGGHYNHEFFWKIMAPQAQATEPSGKLSKLIVRDFNSVEAFKMHFNEAAKSRFGSGWAWLVYNNDKLIIGSTPNQDNPLMNVSELKGFPVIGLDVWEHAYYLKYQNKRPDYISAWWSVVNWDHIQKRFEINI